ncbi:MAG: M67 family metallopeptidase [Ardenticatenaceae bacterium]|nr:M67 family metallopeptidase [Anaerolineales bacterium]MCB8921479.1 M67 family metallopeptidase [Ardenticatenaceae bacterium]MCB8990886.1 M67 family metallopeptidase [Ardenticatenaceae bacterium]MCB9004953.1 M67 family metallopeptidase [Ardenticatenaceae bacterium]
MTRPTRLTVPANLLHVMLAQAQAEYPLEACGLLGGENGRASHLYAIENQLHSPTRYEMAPVQQLQAMLHIEEHDSELLAIYHSHPRGPQTPSPTDIALAYYPGVVYLIISLQNRHTPHVRGFFIESNEVHEVAISIQEM